MNYVKLSQRIVRKKTNYMYSWSVQFSFRRVQNTSVLFLGDLGKETAPVQQEINKKTGRNMVTFGLLDGVVLLAFPRSDARRWDLAPLMRGSCSVCGEPVHILAQIKTFQFKSTQLSTLDLWSNSNFFSKP